MQFIDVSLQLLHKYLQVKSSRCCANWLPSEKYAPYFTFQLLQFQPHRMGHGQHLNLNKDMEACGLIFRLVCGWLWSSWTPNDSGDRCRHSQVNCKVALSPEKKAKTKQEQKHHEFLYYIYSKLASSCSSPRMFILGAIIRTNTGESEVGLLRPTAEKLV